MTKKRIAALTIALRISAGTEAEAQWSGGSSRARSGWTLSSPRQSFPYADTQAQIAVTCFRGLRIIDVSFSETVNLDITGNHRGMNLTAVTLTIDGKTHGLDGTRFSNPTTSMTIPLGEDPTGVERNLRRGSRATLIVTWKIGGNARFSWPLSGSDRAISQVRGC